MITSNTLVLPPERLVTTRRTPPSKALAVIGASTGLVIFFFVALLPSLVYGGVVGVQVATGIFGVPNGPGVGVSALVALGIVTAVTAVASLFAVVGAVAGTAAGALTRGARARFGKGRSLA
jgi:hypothetical protein